MGICFLCKAGSEPRLKGVTAKYTLPPLSWVQRVGCWQNWPFLLLSDPQQPCALLSWLPHLGVLLLYLLLGKQLCEVFTCLTSLPASNLSLNPTCLQCLHWPYLKTPFFVPITHQVSGHLAIRIKVCWLAHCLFPLPGRRAVVQLVYHHIHHRCYMQPQSSAAKEGMLQFRC